MLKVLLLLCTCASCQFSCCAGLRRALTIESVSDMLACPYDSSNMPIGLLALQFDWSDLLTQHCHTTMLHCCRLSLSVCLQCSLTAGHRAETGKHGRITRNPKHDCWELTTRDIITQTAFVNRKAVFKYASHCFLAKSLGACQANCCCQVNARYTCLAVCASQTMRIYGCAILS